MSENNALVPAVEAEVMPPARLRPVGKRDALVAMPEMTLAAARRRYEHLREFVREQMTPDVDFGPPFEGSTKNTLLKPGGEKLCNFFGLRAIIRLEKEVEDWTGAEHKGEPFFYYRHVAELLNKVGEVVCAVQGSCNSWEKKYRWRDAQRVCPECGKATVFRSKNAAEWFCWRKKDGCGSTYDINDPAITRQQAGRMPNPDIFDQVNTILKMSEKRAFLAAVIIGCTASEYFTIDLEDRDEPPTETDWEQAERVARERDAAAMRAHVDAPEMTGKSTARGPSQTSDGAGLGIGPDVQADGQDAQELGRGLAALGMVKRSGAGFAVGNPNGETRMVWTDSKGVTRCNCLPYRQGASSDPAFKCADIWAVEFSMGTQAAPAVAEAAAALPETATARMSVKPATEVEPHLITARRLQTLKDLAKDAGVDVDREAETRWGVDGAAMITPEQSQELLVWLSGLPPRELQVEPDRQAVAEAQVAAAAAEQEPEAGPAAAGDWFGGQWKCLPDTQRRLTAVLREMVGHRHPEHLSWEDMCAALHGQFVVDHPRDLSEEQAVYTEQRLRKLLERLDNEMRPRPVAAEQATEGKPARGRKAARK